MNLASISVKVLAASLLIASTTGAAFAQENYKGEVAEPCPPPPMLRDGFYVGGQVGYDNYRIRHDFSVLATGTGLSPAGTVVLAGDPALSARGWNAGLFLGYGRYLTDVFYVGGEVFANYTNARTSFTFTDVDGGTFSGKARARNNYGLSLLPGIRLNNASTAYVRVGYTWTNVRGSISIDDPDFGVDAVSASSSNRRGGWHWGLGVETLLCDMWSLRADYTYTRINTKNHNAYTDITASDNAFNLGIVYHFA